MNHTTPNSLIHEKSPYLLQHAYNPVDWHPWNEEVFAYAKKEDKPVFLSIGYSTCHWCHVMAHESFEDEEIAKLLNQNYVCIKVDREERPDIDSVYMSVCQALTGSGGWPLTIIMTPQQKPFYAATYLPKFSKWGSLGLTEVLTTIIQLWKNERNKLLETGEEITHFINETNNLSANQAIEPTKDLLFTAVNVFKKVYDKKWGGFGQAPKFPTPHNLYFLLRHSYFEKDNTTLEMVEKSLIQMYRGGIYDHIGGGFSRYSTDEKWLIPHFEKMLYDNALLLYAYVEAYRITNHKIYEIVAKGILKYVLSELTSEFGGFYCGQDADSDGVEGKYYVLKPEEIIEVLGNEDASIFCNWFGITKTGNFEGANIPNLIDNNKFQTPNEKINAFCQKLYAYRLKRTKLHKDDKILTSWNGLMIAALAKSYTVLDDNTYLSAAKNAQVFIDENLTHNDKLFIRYREGHTAHDGQLDDYAFYAFGLLSLYEATFDINYLRKAIQITEKMLSLFADEAQGGFYMYAHDSAKLISRPKEFYDGAIPSGNSVAAYVLVWLFHLTGEIKWQTALNKQIAFLSNIIWKSPTSHSFSLLSLQNMLYSHSEIVCVTANETNLNELKSLYNIVPFQLSIILKTPANQKTLSIAAPFTKDYLIPSNGTQYYLCKNGSCLQPVDSLLKLKDLLIEDKTPLLKN